MFSNDIEGACEAVECLIQEGHERIGVITGPSTSKPGNDRCIGYRRALEKHGIKVDESYIVSGRFKEEGSYQAMKMLMERKDPPTAVFTCNNLL